MKHIKIWLSSLLVIQLILVAGLWWYAENQSNNNLPHALLNIHWEDVDKVMITSDNDTVSLGRQDAQWQLLEHGLPVQNSRVKDLLDKLEQLQVKWPIASNKTSHSRFEVSEEEAQRRIALHSGDRVFGEILIGSSPGLKQLHVRKAGSDEVYVVALDLEDIPPKTTDWLDKSLLSAKNIDRIEGDNFVWAQTRNDWQLSRKGPAVLIDQENPVAENKQKPDSLLSTLEKLRVTGVMEDRPDLAESAAIKLDVTSGNNSWHYTFHEHNGRHFIQRNDFNSLFIFLKSDYEKIERSRIRWNRSEKVGP